MYNQRRVTGVFLRSLQEMTRIVDKIFSNISAAEFMQVTFTKKISNPPTAVRNFIIGTFVERTDETRIFISRIENKGLFAPFFVRNNSSENLKFYVLSITDYKDRQWIFIYSFFSKLLSRPNFNNLLKNS